MTTSATRMWTRCTEHSVLDENTTYDPLTIEELKRVRNPQNYRFVHYGDSVDNRSVLFNGEQTGKSSGMRMSRALRVEKAFYHFLVRKP